MLVAHLDVIDRISASAARRHRLPSGDAEEFGAAVRLKFVENDYGILRKFRRESSLNTYLTMVIERLLLDQCRREWGRPRPSVAARRLGPVAVLVEQLTTRDGASWAHVRGVVETTYGQGTAAHLDELAPCSWPHGRARFIGIEAATKAQAAPLYHDESVLSGQSRLAAVRSKAALAAAVRGLAPAHRTILHLRFGAGLSVADVSRALSTDQKRLYREIDRILAAMRRDLERAGVSSQDVA